MIHGKYRSSTWVLILLTAGCMILLIQCTEYDYYAPMKCLTGTVKYDTTGAAKRLNVASVAMQCDRDPLVNRQKISDFIEQIVTENPDVELIVFGETILGWYEDPEDQGTYQSSLAESVPGPTTDMVSDLAARYQLYVTFGMVQILDGDLYNSQPVIGPDGSILAVHHKTYLTPSDKEAGYREGTYLTVVNIGAITTGIVICKDQENSFLTREVVEKGCELVIISYADDIVEDYLGYASELSRKYSAWLVSSNRFGAEGEVFYKGEIRVSDPGGNHHVRIEGGERYLYYSIPIHD